MAPDYSYKTSLQLTDPMETWDLWVLSNGSSKFRPMIYLSILFASLRALIIDLPSFTGASPMTPLASKVPMTSFVAIKLKFSAQYFPVSIDLDSRAY